MGETLQSLALVGAIGLVGAGILSLQYMEKKQEERAVETRREQKLEILQDMYATNPNQFEGIYELGFYIPPRDSDLIRDGTAEWLGN